MTSTNHPVMTPSTLTFTLKTLAAATLTATTLSACGGHPQSSDTTPRPAAEVKSLIEAEALEADLADRDDRQMARRKVAQVNTAKASNGQPSPGTNRPDASLAQADAQHEFLAGHSIASFVPLPAPVDLPVSIPENRERYQSFDDNATTRVIDDPVSTFSIDVDTGAYSNVRRFLTAGTLPPVDAVRIEELINYFDYDYAVSSDASMPFTVTTDVGPTPWNDGTRLLRVGLKGFEPQPDQRPNANLVFLVDVSGSMESSDKLGLLKTSLTLLASELGGDDSVAIVVYAGASGVALEPIAGNENMAIARALDKLTAGGSTNGEAGIELAYRLADEHFIDGGVNRVILATDGDFNIGISDTDTLIELIEARRRSGIALTTLGFGTGNTNDHLMERLADAGNGNYAYIDTLSEARKVLVDELTSTLLTVASDVKIQVEFNPAVVAEYRLIGYTNRLLADEDFTDDRVDAGDIGAGHTVTALYEIALHGEGGERHLPSRYSADDRHHVGQSSNEIAQVRLRYKRPGESDSQGLKSLVRLDAAIESLDAASNDFRFATAVAAFGQHLRGDTRRGNLSLAAVATLARTAKGEDPFGYRAEFIRLVETADALERVQNPLTRRDLQDDSRG